MKITMLGTGNALVTECYNTCFALEDEGKYFMIDGGGGNEVLKQLKRAGLNWMDMRDIFVTHKHIDHILGIVWMMRLICQNMNKGTYEGDAFIYGHDEVIALLKDMTEKLLQPKQIKMIGDRLHLITVHDGETRKIIDRDVTFFRYSFYQSEAIGFTLNMGNGDKFTCCGDDHITSRRPYAENSKWLLHEAFCLYSQADRFSPYEKHHSTVKDACDACRRITCIKPPPLPYRG